MSASAAGHHDRAEDGHVQLVSLDQNGPGHGGDSSGHTPMRIHPDFGIVDFAEFGRQLILASPTLGVDFSRTVHEEWRKLPMAEEMEQAIVHHGNDPMPAQRAPGDHGMGRVDGQNKHAWISW